MNFKFPTKGRPCTVNVYVVTKTPQKICVIAFDQKKKNMQYLNHCGMVDMKTNDGLYRRKYEIMMPTSPEELTVAVFNPKNGNKKGDNTFKVEKFGVTNLKKWDIWMNSHTQDFVKLAQQFSQNAELLRTWEESGRIENGGLYMSDDKKFKIRYWDVIRDGKGNPLTTPARIGSKSGIIDVSKKYFTKYSVAMRMIILLHEYSHVWLNSKQENEIMADLNGLYVYLGLGYSPIEAHRAFLYVFDNADTAGNRVRYQMIRKYVADFMSGNIVRPSNHNQLQLRKAA